MGLCWAGPKKCLGKETQLESEGLIAACRNMQSHNSQLEGHTKEVIGSVTATNGVSADGLNQVINYITDWSKNAVGSIRLCKQDIIGYKGSSKKRKEEESRFSQLADEYVRNSQEMLEFLVELDSFLKSARHYHGNTESVVEAYFAKEVITRDDYKRIFANLKNLRDGHTGSDQCVKKLLEKVQSLLDKLNKFLQDSNTEFTNKLDRKQEKIGTWRKIFTFLVVGSVAAILVCAIVMAVVAPPTVIAIVTSIVACIGPGIKGYEWITCLLKKLEDELKQKQRAAELMHDNTRASLKELGDIKVGIGKLVNQINAILLNPESPIDEGQVHFTMNDIKKNLGPLHTIIEDLEAKASKCSLEISEGRSDVIKVASGLAKAKKYFI